MKQVFLLLTILVLVLSFTASAQVPKKISYQGLLTTSEGTPVIDGSYNLRFEIYNLPTGGTLRYTQTSSGVSVSKGTFSITLGPLPAIFSESLYVQVTALEGSPGIPSDITFSPRSELTSAPYALRSLFSDTAEYARATAPGGGSYLPLGGGTMTGAITNTGDPAITMGKGNFGTGNTNEGIGAFVAGSNNHARGNFSVVGGGGGGLADSNSASYFSTIGGGKRNLASGPGATIGGGIGNIASGPSSVIGGGGNWLSPYNGNTASGNYNVIGGGYQNYTSGDYSTIGGGFNNAIYNRGTISGGHNNNASNTGATVSGGGYNKARGYYSVIGGGGGPVLPDSNSALGDYSTIPGGRRNKAVGNYSFAAGRRAKANYGGNFVWADSTDADYESTGDNQFLIRAGGGVGINTNSPTQPLEVSGIIYSNTGGFKFPDGTTQTTAASGGGSYLPLAGGTMTGAITSTGDPEITMGKGNFGTGNINSGVQAFVAGSNNRARGDYSVVSGGGGEAEEDSNSAPGSRSTIGGGGHNIASGYEGTVGGGYYNVASGAWWPTVGGGRLNTSSGENYPTVAGGSLNTASGLQGATVGGGFHNTASGSIATVGGGVYNTASGLGATVGGGTANTAIGQYSTVSGGGGTIPSDPNSAVGDWSMIPGGRGNIAGGNYSFAAGWRAKANYGGNFVWADSTDADFASTAPNQFLIRASGNVGINTNSPTSPLTVNGIVQSTTGGFKFPDGTTQTTAASGGSSYLPLAGGTMTGAIANTGDPAIKMGKGNFGSWNTNSGNSAFVAGWNNGASGGYSTVPGGFLNASNGDYSAVGGGYANGALGEFSVVPGGNSNSATGIKSFAAGNRAKANHAGTFVWADSTGADFTSTAANQFLIRAGGHVGINVNNPSEDLDVLGSARLRGIGTSTGTTVVADANGVLYKSSSSRRYKENIQPLTVNTEAVLQLQPVSFQYKQTGAGDVGLIAEDVEKAIKDLVIYDKDGRPDGVKYDRVAVYLLEVVKKQQQEISELKAAVKSLVADENEAGNKSLGELK